MKKLLFLWLLLTGCHIITRETTDTYSPEGDWKFRMDSPGTGVTEKWHM